LHRQFPERTFSTINAGVNGDNTEGALARLEHDVLRHEPHLATVCFGLNDAVGGRRGLPRFRENLTQIVDRIRQAGAAVVLMTPNMMALHDNEHVDPNFRHVLASLIRCQTGGLLDRYVEEVRGVAAATGAPLADVYAEWKRRQAQGEDMTAHLANGLNHPDAFGHRIAAELLLQVILRQLSSGA
jgi:lysophospholipase L1-like esterase